MNKGKGKTRGKNMTEDDSQALTILDEFYKPHNKKLLEMLKVKGVDFKF